MRKKRLGYGLIVGLPVAFAVLWIILEDWVGALVSLSALSVAGAFVFAIAAYVFLNAPAWLRRFRGVSDLQHVEQLESSGQAQREHYETHRALTFEDFSTSGLVHLIDVGNDRLLCLYGQYYYDFEPSSGGPEVNQPRKFPTTTFSLLRHKKKNQILGLFPGSTVVEPTRCGPITSPAKLDDHGVRLEDGALLSGISFDAAERAVRAIAKRKRK
jgi:hypothetical protein